MITLALTSWNRDSMTFDAFRQVLNDDRISEIVIVDDLSDERIYNNLVFMCNGLDKVKIFRNEQNLDCYRNKRQAVKQATNHWVIIGDSDNIFTKAYVDALFITGWEPDTLLQPSFARPHFNFKAYMGQCISKRNVGQFMKDDTFKTMLNAMNYFVNRDEYLRVWDGSVDPVTSDSIFQNYNWLKAGNSIYVCPGLEYEHRVNNHEGQEPSHYSINFRRTPSGFHNSIEEKLKAW